MRDEPTARFTRLPNITVKAERNITSNCHFSEVASLLRFCMYRLRQYQVEVKPRCIDLQMIFTLIVFGDDDFGDERQQDETYDENYRLQVQMIKRPLQSIL